MESNGSSLEALRAEVDAIDQAIVELLVRRSGVVRRIGAVKGDRLDGRPALRPGREAYILRRVIALARGGFPAAPLVRMWRELLAAQTRLQTPLSVAVVTRTDGLRIWDLARDHFGSATPMMAVDSATQAMRAVSDGSATVTVLPMPGDDDPWWTLLMSDQQRPPRIFARLPFVSPGVGEGDELNALAVGRLELEPSGDDLTLLGIEAEPGMSRGRLRDLLVEAGLEPTWVAVRRPTDLPQALHLVETASFVAKDDERIAAVRRAARGESLRIVPVGGYARPLTPD